MDTIEQILDIITCYRLNHWDTSSCFDRYLAGIVWISPVQGNDYMAENHINKHILIERAEHNGIPSLLR